MQKILTTKQIREADRLTIEREPIDSSDLMERAAKGCVDWIINQYSNNRPFIIFAGIGNNGGDALVVSRHLLKLGFGVKTFVVRYSENFSADCQINLDRLREMGHEVSYILEEAQIPPITSNTVVIDGLFGSGLNRVVEGFAATCIQQINASIADVISIDIPSGMFADKPTPRNSAVINAVHTLTFEVPKLSFMLPGCEEFLQHWTVISIGLDPQYLREAESQIYFVNQLREFSFEFERKRFDHKGIFGHALLVSGSLGKMGASVLSAKAALRSGVGKLSVHIPRCGYNILQATIPEAMAEIDDYVDFIGDTIKTDAYQAVGIGPGLGTGKKTKRSLKTLLNSVKCPVVIDADAINMIATSDDGLSWLPKGAILTPHVGEFERLVGKSSDAFERLEKLNAFATKNKVFVLLKGAHSVLATPDGQLYFNSTGNAGMATAGSGDVLTGIITSFLAQGKSPKLAALAGMYVHGLAGDIAAETFGQHALIASDIIEHLGDAMLNTFSFEA
jgi:ADP-dependent NAD(P)H-hydrate dehydratase / NAD(P)H-hydrate epimerase